MTNLLIVGAGPAGLSAAIAASEQGLRVKIVDEFPRPGGRLLGQLHEEPSGTWWNGIEEAKRLHEQALAAGVIIECGTSVYDIANTNKCWNISTSNGKVEVPKLLLATGAAEVAVPIPGWTLPGVMSIGAAQVMTNVQRVKVGSRGVVIGVNVLSVAITRELQLAGIQVDRMLLPVSNTLTKEAGSPRNVMDSMLRVAHLAPSPIIRFGSRLMKWSWMKELALQLLPTNGIQMWGIPIQLKTAALEIIGDKQVEGVRIANLTPDGESVPGTEKVISADFVCIAGGLYPLVELAAIAGCPFAYLPELGGHVPLHSERMRTPLDGLYVAGNITGIESAKVAISQGTVAGLSIADDLGCLNDKQRLKSAIDKVLITRQNATIQFHPQIAHGRASIQTLFANHEIN
ncbi:NAD(P)/FAD-dependent oxidoreductase [Paenibacillus sp. N3.4]|uniref:NAD(P)/FAD-dependent oxidoreductase n=1 Tax=Paenibacillus sp. N3.4 TaxID=2603222 RepID=UPI0011CC4EA9|nr:FAD-dependent oxidoreductase [Paenibacillus sp. N3.4]TXK85953.1 FAD-dependent oxidoreductase [Paenibacillus sp. N3.4]